jgi:ribose transport system permease protein
MEKKPLEPPARRRLSLPAWFGAALAIIILVGVTSILQPTFLKPQNIVNIVNEQATVGIVAVGMTIVIIAGGIDLSVGSMLALAGGCSILTLNGLIDRQDGDLKSVIGAALAAIVVGLLAGFFNGILAAKGRIAPFIATLGALLAYRSAAQWIANGGQFFAHESPLFSQIGQGIPIPHTNVSRNIRRVIPLLFPYAVMVWIGVAIAGWVLLNRTRLGRYIIAVGNNPRAALYSAVPVDRVRILSYTILGLLVGMAAFMESARYTSVNSGSSGLFLELYAIAAAVIGGSRIEGGAGSIGGAVIGALLLGVIKNVMVMLKIDSHAQGLAMGVIIIAAALIQRLRARD